MSKIINNIFFLFLLIMSFILLFQNNIQKPEPPIDIKLETKHEEKKEEKQDVSTKSKTFYYWNAKTNKLCSDADIKNKNIPCEVKLGEPPEKKIDVKPEPRPDNKK